MSYTMCDLTKLWDVKEPNRELSIYSLLWRADRFNALQINDHRIWYVSTMDYEYPTETLVCINIESNR